MLCCIGLFGGLYVGQSLGGHWTVTAPALGFGLGFIGDMKFMRGMHGRNSQNSHQNSSMSGGDSSSQEEETANPLLQTDDVQPTKVRRDNG